PSVPSLLPRLLLDSLLGLHANHPDAHTEHAVLVDVVVDLLAERQLAATPALLLPRFSRANRHGERVAGVDRVEVFVVLLRVQPAAKPPATASFGPFRARLLARPRQVERVVR